MDKSMNHPFLHRLRKLFSSDTFSFFVLVSIVLLAHASVLFPTHIINPDSQYIFPILENAKGLFDYLGKLVRYETLDFQPVRDLTLLLDFYFYQKTGLVISVFLNCLIWAGACFFITKIIRETISNKISNYVFVICFAVYPIFAQTINWGIARKHLLAFFFTVWATYELFRWVRTNKGEFSICLLYALSVLSLPVSLLWPIWVAFSIRLLWPEKWTSFRKTLLFLVTIMCLVTFINWSYYKTSMVFLETYPQKEGRLDFVLMFIAFGHYVKQIIFPYQLAFTYAYNDGALIGLVIFILFCIWFIYFHRKNRQAIAWSFFGLVHLAVLLSSPSIYFDTYLLMPALAMFMVMLTIYPSPPKPIVPLLSVLALVWGGITFSSSSRWTDRIAFFGESFMQDPTCTNAVAFATSHYLKGKKAPDDLFRYIQENTCTEPMPGEPVSKIYKLMNFEALQLYVEDEIDLDYRLRRMKELGRMNYTPMLIYASLLAKLERKDEVEASAMYLNKFFTSSSHRIDYHPIYSKVLPPYCKKHQLSECNKLLEHLSPEKEDPFL